eukprot:7982377-Lingulodinium_polyedra.AAC.1
MRRPRRRRSSLPSFSPPVCWRPTVEQPLAVLSRATLSGLPLFARTHRTRRPDVRCSAWPAFAKP